MRFLAQSFVVHFKLIFKSRTFVFVSVIAAILTGALSVFFSQGSTMFTVKAGIYAESGDSVTDEAISCLLENTSVDFILFEQEEEMIGQVKTGELECGYVFSEGLKENIRKERYDKLITLYTSPATVSTGILNELVYASVIRGSSAMVAARLTGGEQKDFEKRVQSYYDSDIFLTPLITYVNIPQDISNPYHSKVIHSIMILCIFVFVYFMVPKKINEISKNGDKSSSISKFLSQPNQPFYKSKVWIYYLAMLTAIFLAVVCIGIISMGIAEVINSELIFSLATELKALAGIGFVYSAIAMVPIILLKNTNILYGAFIYIFALNIILGNLFIDLREVSEFLGSLQIMPSNYYMNYLFG